MKNVSTVQWAHNNIGQKKQTCFQILENNSKSNLGSEEHEGE